MPRLRERTRRPSPLGGLGAGRTLVTSPSGARDLEHPSAERDGLYHLDRVAEAEQPALELEARRDRGAQDHVSVLQTLERLIVGLTPGDFAIASHRLRTLGRRLEPASLAAALAEEWRSKPESRARPAGFRR